MTVSPLPADVFTEACPSRLVLSRIAGKWPLLVIDALGGGAMRNGALLRRIDGVSQKMLTETLRELESLDLVERTVFEKVPPHVEYRLTPLGESLSSVVAELDRWVERHLHQLGALSQGPAPAPAEGYAQEFHPRIVRAGGAPRTAT